MNFLFKKPSKKTQNIKSKIALGEKFFDYVEKLACNKIKKTTNHSHCHITNSGNASILIALSLIEGDVIIPDQGGWNGFKQIAKFLKKNIQFVKTDLGIINTDYLNELNIPKNSALILSSFAGYCAEQDIKSISQYCHENKITVIEDASGGICDNKKKLANGRFSDIIVASTGSPKMINVESGGFISYDDEGIFEKIKVPLKISKSDEITAGAIACEIDFTENNFKKTVKACDYIKNNIEETIHNDKRGINVIFKTDNAKKIGFNLKNELPINEKSFITKCPNYNRVKEKAIAIELKNLEISSLEKENLDKIIEKVKYYQ